MDRVLAFEAGTGPLCIDSPLFSSSSKDFNLEVLRLFIRLQDFRGKSIVDALRYVDS